MEILRKGNFIDDSPKTVECPNCHSLLRITKDDIKNDFDSITFKITNYYIECPLCREKSHSSWRYLRINDIEKYWRPDTTGHPFRTMGKE